MLPQRLCSIAVVVLIVLFVAALRYMPLSTSFNKLFFELFYISFVFLQLNYQCALFNLRRHSSLIAT